VKFSLLFGVAAKATCAEIYLVSLVIDPIDMVAVFFELNL
jgi:hypothetical protein